MASESGTTGSEGGGDHSRMFPSEPSAATHPSQRERHTAEGATPPSARPGDAALKEVFNAVPAERERAVPKDPLPARDDQGAKQDQVAMTSLLGRMGLNPEAIKQHQATQRTAVTAGIAQAEDKPTVAPGPPEIAARVAQGKGRHAREWGGRGINVVVVNRESVVLFLMWITIPSILGGQGKGDALSGHRSCLCGREDARAARSREGLLQ